MGNESHGGEGRGIATLVKKWDKLRHSDHIVELFHVPQGVRHGQALRDQESHLERAQQVGAKR
jgi:hypothetical protein